MIFILWIVLSVFVTQIAINKGNNGVVIFFISIFLSPLVGFLIAVICSPDTAKLERRKITNGTAKRCHSCAELIQPKANVCHYCGTECKTGKTGVAVQ
jgi:NhaP-type Na+/H+ or K+/H+ antiporter